MKTIKLNDSHTLIIKGKYAFLLVLFIVIMPLSCQKIINVDLNSTSPKLSIHGLYSKKLSRLFVQISSTSSYFINSGVSYIPIKSDVSINLKSDDNTILASTTDGKGEKIEFSENSYYNESYTTEDKKRPAYQVEVDLAPGKVYTLEVSYEGNIYISTSKLFTPVTVNKAVYVDNTFNSSNAAKLYDINVFFQDDSESEYYLIKYTSYPIYKIYNDIPDLDLSKYVKLTYNNSDNYYTPESQKVPVKGKPPVESIYLADLSVRLMNKLNRKGPEFRYKVNSNVIEANLPPNNGHIVAVSTIDKAHYLYLKQLQSIVSDGGRPGGGSISAPGNPVKYWKTSDGKSADVLGYFGCVNYGIINQVIKE